MLWVALLVGAFAGALLFEEEGIIPGLLVGFLAHQQTDLRRRVKALEAELSRRSTFATPTEPLVPAPKPPAEAPPHVLAEAPATVIPDEPAEPTIAAPLVPRAPTFVDEGIAALRRFLFGGNVLVRAGVVILFFALSFLVKLAIDNQLFPIELRLAAVAAVGIALVGTGWRLRLQRRAYGLSLQGGGLAVMYLTLYAAFKLYDLLPPGLALALLLATALLGAAIAILEESEGLAVIGFLGGFFAPVLASTGSGDHVLLFGFYAVLNIGLLAIAWFKPWRWLNWVGFYSTFGIGAAWGGFQYEPALYESTQPFLVFFFLCYFALSVLYATRPRREGRQAVDGTLVFGLPVAAFALQAALVEPFAYGLAWSSLAMGAFYAVAAWFVYQRSPHLLRLLVESFAAIALGLLTMTLPFAVDATWTGAGWALEGAALVWLGCRQGQLRVRLFGAILQLAAGVFLFQAIDETPFDVREAFRIFLNPLATGFATLSLAAIFTAFHIHRSRDRIREWERALEPLFLVVGLAWLAGGALFELTRVFTGKTAIDSYLLFLAAAALGMYTSGRRLNWEGLRLAALFPLPLYVLALIPTLFYDHPLADLGAPVWFSSFASLWFLLHRVEGELPRRVGDTYHVALFWLVILVASWSGASWLSRISGSDRSAWTILGLLLPTLVGALIAILGHQYGRWPFAGRSRTYFTFAVPLPLLAFWVGSLYGLSRPAAAVPLPYVPILNPLDIVLGLAAVTSIYWFRAARNEARWMASDAARRGAIWGLVITVFLWLNATIARTVHFWADVPYAVESLSRSSLFQTALSICWTVIGVAAMAWAHRSSRRTVWFAAAGLLALVVAKLFIVDLSALNMAMKVVSFMVVGILLLIIGYVAPVPPARPEPTPNAPSPETPPPDGKTS
jgi:uncharacterized membrane protein